MKYFHFIIVVCAIVSCSQDDDSSNSGSETDLITKSAWKLDALGFDIDKNGSIDLNVPIKDCQADDIFTFSNSGSGTFNNGSVKCENDDPAMATFSWILQNKTLTANIPGLLSGTAAINTLNTNRLELWKDTTYNSIPGRAIVTLKH